MTQDSEPTGCVTAWSHKVDHVLCMLCLRRWTVMQDNAVAVESLRCPRCHRRGYAVIVGQSSDEEKEIANGE